MHGRRIFVAICAAIVIGALAGNAPAVAADGWSASADLWSGSGSATDPVMAAAPDGSAVVAWDRDPLLPLPGRDSHPALLQTHRAPAAPRAPPAPDDHRQGRPGANAVRFTGRIGHSALTPGRWRVTLAAAAPPDTAAPQSRTFTVLPG